MSGTGNYRYLRDSTYTKGIVKITIFKAKNRGRLIYQVDLYSGKYGIR